MLINHKGPPGPSNRGEKSEVKYDKRPMHEQALDIKDNRRISTKSKNLTELNSLLDHFTVVDDVFQ